MEKPKKSTYKYCIVPKCRNTIRTTPDKVFFLVPRGMEIRKKWCKIMKRPMTSASSCLYCCEDHFNIEEDTSNYIKYKIMYLQHNQKTTLQLKKDVFPHKFECQNDNHLDRKEVINRKHQKNIRRKNKDNLLSFSTEETVNAVNMTEKSQNNNLEVGPSVTFLHMDLEYTENEIKREIIDDDPIEIGEKVEDDPVDIGAIVEDDPVDIGAIVEDDPVDIGAIVEDDPVDIGAIVENDPVDIGQIVEEDPTDTAPTSPTQPFILWSFEQEICSEVNCTEDDKENETQFENQMRSCMLMAIEKEPQMMLGLPKESYYIIQSLSESIPLPTVEILITLKKIKLNESFNILALQFGYTPNVISTIFFKSLPLLAEKLKQSIIWPISEENSKTLPSSFRARCNVVSIIDFLEIHIEKPPDAIHKVIRSEKCLYNTLRYLVSCTPDGLVNFVSVGYSSKATDEMIVEDCGFLDHLPTKAAVMADTGFEDVSCLLEKKNCTLMPVLQTPSILTSSRKDAKKRKRISALRIHIKQVISKLREFHMLLPHVYIDHNLIPGLDDVMVIACGIINTRGVLIKKESI